jgi:adenylate cyclase, class 2
MSIEIELRYQVLDAGPLQSFIQTLEYIQTKRVLDIYLDTPGGDVRKRGIFIRVRDNKKIDIKFNRACLQDITLEQQPYCEEHSFLLPIANQELEKFNKLNEELGLQGVQQFALELYKQANSLIDHRIVDKLRSSYKALDFELVFDDVKDLGQFIEIELMASSQEDIDTIVVQMRNLLDGLPLKPLTTGYDSLVLRKQNFEQYLQGRFILEEDKKFLQRST